MTTHPPAPATISVIIPARNEEALIASTVASVLRSRAVWLGSTGPETVVEILVIDNASTDGTVAAVARLVGTIAADLRVVACPDRGAAHARNLGARLATGLILVFLDADTQLPPEAIGRFAELADAGGYEAGITRLGALDGDWRARGWWACWNAVRRLPLPRAKAMPACMFCTRAAFDEFGPFDVRVDIGEEWPILAGLYRRRPRRLIYDQSLTALSSSRRMDLQRFGYTRTFARYVWAILSRRGRVNYPDHIRHRAEVVAPVGRWERDSRLAER